MAVSPITGELIPVDQMAEHMRVSLIDPKFQEQRQAMMSKIRETTKASDDEIGRNLMGLARKRPDVFGQSASFTLLHLYFVLSVLLMCILLAAWLSAVHIRIESNRHTRLVSALFATLPSA